MHVNLDHSAFGVLFTKTRYINSLLSLLSLRRALCAASRILCRPGEGQEDVRGPVESDLHPTIVGLHASSSRPSGLADSHRDSNAPSLGMLLLLLMMIDDDDDGFHIQPQHQKLVNCIINIARSSCIVENSTIT